MNTLRSTAMHHRERRRWYKTVVRLEMWRPRKRADPPVSTFCTDTRATGLKTPHPRGGGQVEMQYVQTQSNTQYSTTHKNEIALSCVWQPALLSMANIKNSVKLPGKEMKKSIQTSRNISSNVRTSSSLLIITSCEDL